MRAVSERTAKGILTAAVVWVLIIAAVGALYKFLVQPQVRKNTEEATSSESRYKTSIAVAADSFSGYGILRSEKIGELLAAEGIRLSVRDDRADYNARLRALRDGEVQMAVFTVDSLLSACARLGEFPATIVMIVDESKGADAIVAYKASVSNIEDLNSESAAFVLTPDSPSEFLARVTIANFNLPRLPEKWYRPANGAEEVFSEFTSDNGKEKRAYVLWEPYVSRALERDDAHLLIDSSNLKGLIVDVLVAQRSFLQSKPEQVRKVVEAYLRALYQYDREPGGIEKLFAEDMGKTGSSSLAPDQAKRLTQTIRLKNTLENYAHFGLLPESESKGLTHLEDIIGNITRILIRTGVFESDPLKGRAPSLFYDRILRQLKDDRFHPASLGLVQGVEPGAGDREQIRGEENLGTLSDQQWAQLVSVGTLSARPIRFARGTARINLQSERDLDELALRLESLPRYYIRVVGHTRSEGDVEANRKLAQQRADAATKYVIEKGLSPNRVRAEASEPEEGGGEAQSVTFVVGQLPY